MKNNNENTTQDKNEDKRIPRIINRSSLAVVINPRETDKTSSNRAIYQIGQRSLLPGRNIRISSLTMYSGEARRRRSGSSRSWGG